MSIRERGYAATTLTDIATAAGMSPSHVHYYFEGKAAVLEYHFDGLVGGLLSDVLPLADKPPLERIDATVAFFFDNPELRRERAGVYFEIFGVAVHSDGIRAIKKRWDNAMREFFVELFAETDLSPRAAENAADIALGLLTGLSTNAYFDDDRSRSQAGEVFRSELLRLAGATPTTRVHPEERP
jgi:AcrR family transcriptional regulator